VITLATENNKKKTKDEHVKAIREHSKKYLFPSIKKDISKKN